MKIILYWCKVGQITPLRATDASFLHPANNFIPQHSSIHYLPLWVHGIPISLPLVKMFHHATLAYFTQFINFPNFLYGDRTHFCVLSPLVCQLDNGDLIDKLPAVSQTSRCDAQIFVAPPFALAAFPQSLSTKLSVRFPQALNHLV